MEPLRKIQKTFHVFEVLTKIAYMFSIVGAVICAVGALCAFSWYSGGQVFSLFGEPVTIFSTGRGMNEMLAVLLGDCIMLTAEAILLCFAVTVSKTFPSGVSIASVMAFMLPKVSASFRKGNAPAVVFTVNRSSARSNAAVS